MHILAALLLFNIGDFPATLSLVGLAFFHVCVTHLLHRVVEEVISVYYTLIPVVMVYY